jgi:hypothetical protein
MLTDEIFDPNAFPEKTTSFAIRSRTAVVVQYLGTGAHACACGGDFQYALSRSPG